LAVVLECVEFEKSTDKSVLDHIFGLFGRPDDLKHGGVKAVLIAVDQTFESGPISGQRRFNQLPIVRHENYAIARPCQTKRRWPSAMEGPGVFILNRMGDWRA
jgi:hypothetical protein